MRARRIVSLVAALCAVALLSACVNVPTSGPVVVASQHAHSAEPQIDIRPQPPAPDADSLAVVNGFLVAMADSGGDLTLARQYLTPDAAKSWRPDHGIQVYSSTTVPHSSNNTVTLDGTAIGAVDLRGSYVAHRQVLHQDFELIKVAGQWRINNPPDGLLMSSTLFANNYAPSSIYFYDNTLATLVPDVIYRPRQQLGASSLVRALLAGPTDWLAPAVTSAIPRNSQIGTGGVVTNAAGTTTVSLTGLGAVTSDDARTRLAAQILLTLHRNTSAVTGLVLLDDTAPFPLPDSVNGVWPLERTVGFDPTGARSIPDLFAVSDDHIVRISDAAGEPKVEDVVSPIGARGLGIDSLAVALDGSEIAVVAGGRNRLIVGAASPQSPTTTLLEEPGLLRPQFSRYGELWAMSTAGNSTVVHRFVGTQAVDVSAPGLQGIAVDHFRISPDGTHLIVLGRRDNAPVLGMLQIRRTASSVTVDNWRPLDVSGDGTGPTTIASIGWRSDTQLVLLGSERETGVANPYEFDLDGQTVLRAAVNLDGTALATMPYGRFQAVVLTEDGYLVRRSDTDRWPSYENRVKLTAIAYPG